jgi:hypothetical protein
MLNPFTNLLASSTMIAFMTNKNNPSVMIVMGRVKIMSKGLMKVFKMASTTAKTKAVQNVST